MQPSRRLGTIFGGFAAAGALAVAVVSPASGAASSAPATQALAAFSATTSTPAPAAGNPAGHVAVPPAGRAVNTSHPNRVVGHGTAASCTSAAVVSAVAAGGIITFDCGAKPVTITMTATAKVVNTSHQVVIDGGNKVTLSGAGRNRILYMSTCDPKQKFTTTHCQDQQWPLLVVQNITLRDAYAAAHESPTVPYGGGDIYAQGGQLKVVNSTLSSSRCFAAGPDVSGGGLRAFGPYPKSPVYLTGDTFANDSCSDGGAVGGLAANFVILNSVLIGNKAIGHPGAGGVGGAFYSDGNSYNVTLGGDAISDNTSSSFGGAIMDVVDNGRGTLTIESSTLHHNPPGNKVQVAPGVYDEVDGRLVKPVVINSTIN
jgi:hypothetical protein